jgi:hypothetical protein
MVFLTDSVNKEYCWVSAIGDSIGIQPVKLKLQKKSISLR